MSGDWAAEAAAELRKRAADMQRREAILLEQRKLREEQGPGLWGFVQVEVAELCEKLNREYGQQIAFFKSVRSGEFEAKLELPNGVSTLSGRFATTTAPDALKWFYGGPAATQGAHNGTYMLSVVGADVGFSQNGIQFVNPKDIAKEMMSGLIKG